MQNVSSVIPKFSFLYSCVLFTESFSADEQKTADNIISILQQKFEEFDIGIEGLRKLTFVTDRGSNIVSAMNKLGIQRLNCNAHLINNILTDVFDDQYLSENVVEVQSMIMVCKKLVTYFKKSGDIKKLPTGVQQECDTRWVQHCTNAIRI